MIKLLERLSSSIVVWRSSRMLNICKLQTRSFADSKTPTSSSKQIMVQGNESERVRVRRVRQSDTPRLLRFVRNHPHGAWPGLFSNPTPAPSAACYLMLSDYVARILAQGHSMVAEQIKSRRGWTSIHGLALTAAVCPWDATLLQHWAQCIRCARSKRFLHFSALCMRAPQLHEKYHVHKILQVILILPPESVQNSEVVQMLARSAIQRGREVGCPLLRFDVTNNTVAKALEDLNLTKEWHLSYNVVPEQMMEDNPLSNTDSMKQGNFVTVYTAFTAAPQPKVKPDPPSDASLNLPALTPTKPANSTTIKKANPKTSSTTNSMNVKTQSTTNAANIPTNNLKVNPNKAAINTSMPDSAANTATVQSTKEKIDLKANPKISPNNNSKTNAQSNTTTISKTKQNSYRTPDAATDSTTTANLKIVPTMNPATNPTIGCSIRWIGPTIDLKADSTTNLNNETATGPKIVPTINPATFSATIINTEQEITSKNNTNDVKNDKKDDQATDSGTNLKKLPKMNPVTNNDSHSTKHLTDNPGTDTIKNINSESNLRTMKKNVATIMDNNFTNFTPVSPMKNPASNKKAEMKPINDPPGK